MKKTNRIRIILRTTNEAAICCLISQLEKACQYGIPKRQLLQAIIYWRLKDTTDTAKIVALNADEILRTQKSNTTVVLDLQKITDETILKWLNDKNDGRMISTKTKNILRSVIEITDDKTTIDIKKIFEVVTFFDSGKQVSIQHDRKATPQDAHKEFLDNVDDKSIGGEEKINNTPNKAATEHVQQKEDAEIKKTEWDDGERKVSSATSLLQGLGSSSLRRGLKL